MSDQQPGTDRVSSRRVAVTAAIAAFLTVVLASGATVLVGKLLRDPAAPIALLDVAAAATPSAEPPVATTRLAVQGPRRLLDAQAGGALPAGGEAAVPLPSLPDGTTAVLVQLSLTGATGPGAVTLRSSIEETPALRLAAAGGQTSATVVAHVGADRDLRVWTEGGGQLQVDLVGVFEPAETATAGRIVATPATRVVDLTPREDGDRASVELGAVPTLQAAGAVSAVLLRVSGDVGEHGGYVSVGSSAEQIDQTVYWSATAGTDRIRPGFLVVPVRSGQLHVQYKAGGQLDADIVGYVTGPSAPDATAGLVVPLPPGGAAPVTVTAEGRLDVGVLSPAGVAGLLPERVAAVLVTVDATGGTSAAVTVDAPGSASAGVPNVSAGPSGRSALALSGVVAGAVGVTSTGPAVVVLTPRALVVAD